MAGFPRPRLNPIRWTVRPEDFYSRFPHARPPHRQVGPGPGPTRCVSTSLVSRTCYSPLEPQWSILPKLLLKERVWGVLWFRITLTMIKQSVSSNMMMDVIHWNNIMWISPGREVSWNTLENIDWFIGLFFINSLGRILYTYVYMYISTFVTEYWYRTAKAAPILADWIVECIGHYKLVKLAPSIQYLSQQDFCAIGYPRELVEDEEYSDDETWFLFQWIQAVKTVVSFDRSWLVEWITRAFRILWFRTISDEIKKTDTFSGNIFTIYINSPLPSYICCKHSLHQLPSFFLYGCIMVLRKH